MIKFQIYLPEEIWERIEFLESISINGKKKYKSKAEIIRKCIERGIKK